MSGEAILLVSAPISSHPVASSVDQVPREAAQLRRCAAVGFAAAASSAMLSECITGAHGFRQVAPSTS